MISFKEFKQFKEKINHLLDDDKFKKVINELLNDMEVSIFDESSKLVTKNNSNKNFQLNTRKKNNEYIKSGNIVIEINDNVIQYNEAKDSIVKIGKYYIEDGKVITEYNEKIQDKEQVLIKNEKIILDEHMKKNYKMKELNCSSKDNLSPSYTTLTEEKRIKDTVWVKIDSLKYNSSEFQSKNTTRYYVNRGTDYIEITEDEYNNLLEPKKDKVKGKRYK